MKPYYSEAGIEIYHADCREVLPLLPQGVKVTDPPYNVGYHYDSYADKSTAAEYSVLIRETLFAPSVVIHYPEDSFAVAAALGVTPDKCVAWTYNAHTPRKWRLISWFGVAPDFSRVKQPYRNLADKRILRKIENGSEGADLYDWWHDEQIKNVSLEKTEHPCQIPLAVMSKVISITEGDTILDPFMGSGTTLRAAKDQGRRAIGIEISERYCEIAAQRMSQGVLEFVA